MTLAHGIARRSADTRLFWWFSAHLDRSKLSVDGPIFLYLLLLCSVSIYIQYWPVFNL